MLLPRYLAKRRGVFGSGKTRRQFDAEASVHLKSDKVLLELNEISREIIARLDNKTRMIEQLLDCADKAVTELKLQEHKLQEMLQLVRAEQALLLAQQATPATPAPATTTAAATPTGATPTTPVISADEVRNIEAAAEAMQSEYDAIYRLQDAGKDSRAIAQALGLARNEVDLILRLRTQVKSS